VGSARLHEELSARLAQPRLQKEVIILGQEQDIPVRQFFTYAAIRRPSQVQRDDVVHLDTVGLKGSNQASVG